MTPHCIGVSTPLHCLKSIMVDQQSVLNLISSREHCKRFSPSQISNTLRAVFEPMQNMVSDFAEWNSATVKTTKLCPDWFSLIAPMRDGNTHKV